MSDVYVSRGERLAARRVAGEMVILSADDSSLYVLNELGTLLWEAADGATRLDDIVDRVVCGEFDVDRETGLRDARDFLQQLADHGILQLSNTPIETAATGNPVTSETR
jgi:glycine/D-amino acid oxidase-like deaminating enzyme